MNPLPNIIVIDFCDWLRERISNEGISPLDLFVNREERQQLEAYCKQFLEQRQYNNSDCPIKFVFKQFLSSKEFEYSIKECHKECPMRETAFYNRTYRWEYCFHYCLRNDEIYNAFRRFCRRTNDRMGYSNTNDISYYDLATYMNHLIYTDNSVKSSPQFMRLMVDSRISMADEMDFFEWLQTYKNNPTAIRKMPSVVFEKLVNEYITLNKKGERVKNQLLKSYRQTGWDALLEKIKVLLQINKTKHTKKLDIVLDRYFSHCARFNCIILPLSDYESQKQYQSLITDSWYDLNELSADYLDIYYSETDNGKSGYDIAKRISSLPEGLKKKAPCLIIWEYSIKNSKTIPIDELNSKQILLVIKHIVEMIQQEKDLDLIVKEALKVVKNQQGMNHGATIINVEGDGNVIGNNNKVNIAVVDGDNNNVSFLENQVSPQNLIKEFDQAIKAVDESLELDFEQKKQILEIMQDAKIGTIENSIEKNEKAKKAFNYVKSFLVKTAPTLISVLSNFTQIASYFGL